MPEEQGRNHMTMPKKQLGLGHPLLACPPPMRTLPGSRAIARGARDSDSLSRAINVAASPLSLPVDLYILILFLPRSIGAHRMAIHPKLRPEGPRGSLSPQQTMAISAWTEQAASSLEDLSLSDSTRAGRTAQTPTPARSPLRGATMALSIPLDDQPPASSPRVKVVAPTTDETRPPTVSFRRREPLRRDSLKRREALLKGKDGSRRRQRWENGRRVHGVTLTDSAPTAIEGKC